MIQHGRPILILTLFVVLLGSACETSPRVIKIATATDLPTATLAPSETPIPSQTPTPERTATQTTAPEMEVPQIKLGAATFFDHLNEVDQQVFDILNSENRSPIKHEMISQEEYEEMLPEFLPAPDDALRFYFDNFLYMLSLTPREFDYFEFQDAYDAKVEEFNAGVLLDPNKNTIYLVQDYQDKQAQLAQYIFAVNSIVRSRLVLTADNTRRLAESMVDFDGQEASAGKAGGLGYYTIREWYKNYLIEGEEPVPDSFWRRLDALDMEVPDYLSGFAEFDLDYGLPFIDEVIKSKGAGAVLEVITKPPISTEMIMHPKLYFLRTNEMNMYEHDLGPYLEENWQIWNQTVLGEHFLYLWLTTSVVEEARVEESKAREIAEGWGDDFFVMLVNPETGGIVIEWTIAFDKYLSPKKFEEEMAIYTEAIYQAGVVPFTVISYDNQTFMLVFVTDQESFQAYIRSLERMDAANQQPMEP